jgi:hypothetical protein
MAGGFTPHNELRDAHWQQADTQTGGNVGKHRERRKR